VLDSFLEQYREVLPALSASQLAALEAHLDLLERWNRTINLTGDQSKKGSRLEARRRIALPCRLPGRPLPSGSATWAREEDFRVFRWRLLVRNAKLP